MMCTHGYYQLSHSIALISKERYEYLQSLFPEFHSIQENQIESCDICESELQDMEQTKSVGKSLKNKFKQLWKPSTCPLYFKEFTYYLVSSTFTESFLEYTLGKTFELIGIDNTSLLCCHELLLYDLNDKWDRNSNHFRLLIESEWNQLVQTFGNGNPTLSVSVTQDVNGEDVLFTCNVDVCNDCRKARLLDYIQTTVLVRLIQSDSSDGVDEVDDLSFNTPSKESKDFKESENLKEPAQKKNRGKTCTGYFDCKNLAVFQETSGTVFFCQEHRPKQIPTTVIVVEKEPLTII